MSEYLFANPDDGFAYSPIELEALFAIKVDPMKTHIADDSPLARQWEFHAMAMRLPKLPDPIRDKWALDILTKALLAELEDPNPFITAEESDGA